MNGLYVNNTEKEGVKTKKTTNPQLTDLVPDKTTAKTCIYKRFRVFCLSTTN